MKVSRILHAGYIFESDQSQIVFDPIFENPFSRNCYAYPEVEFDCSQIKKLRPAAVFISHYHDDHCSLESLQYLDRQTRIYLYCLHEELFSMIKDLGFLNVQPLQIDQAVEVGSFRVIPRLALDADVDAIFHIQAEGLNILNVVDAWIDPAAMTKLIQSSWDLVLWPFQTLREIEVIAPSLAKPAELPAEWLDQLKLLNPRFIVPSSCQFIQEPWSWYRKAYFPISYQMFQQEIEASMPKSTVYRMNPGVSIELNRDHLKESAPLPWVVPRAEQDVDYEYDSNQKPMETAEIARYLGKLSAEQEQRANTYCEKDLIEKYNSMNTDITGRWKLLLYDHLGEARTFCYKLQSGSMKLVGAIPACSWVTEVPLAKLYAALEDGESLTSMYLRMKGMPFDNIAEDPLVACLFNGVFGAYQRHQLNKCLDLG